MVSLKFEGGGGGGGGYAGCRVCVFEAKVKGWLSEIDAMIAGV